MKNFFIKVTTILVVTNLFNVFSTFASTKKRFIVRLKESRSLSRMGVSHKKLRRKKRIHKAINKEELKEALGGISISYIEEDIKLDKSTDFNGYVSDELFQDQWALLDYPGSLDMKKVWNLSIGNTSVPIAVIDTGITSHSELEGVFSGGVDMISDESMSRDGDGRDMSPQDEGDWVAYEDSCGGGSFSASSWHGTHVAGIISAKSQNDEGVTGMNWLSPLISIRALGKCGGWTSDIADSIRWAIGEEIEGLEKNSRPAKVINLSLGGVGSCPSYMQEAIDSAKASGAVIVVAAGNNSTDMDIVNITPANCRGVIVVGSSNQSGDFSNFSNYGSYVDVIAPGYSILSLGNNGTTTPGQQGYVTMSGTSMSVPFVSGLVSLIMDINPSLYPDQIEKILKDSAKGESFSGCESAQCGAGLIDAQKALELAKVTVSDSEYTSIEPIEASPEESSSEDTNVTTQKEGGVCGSIDMNGSGGSGPLSLSFIGILFIIAIKFSKVSKLT